MKYRIYDTKQRKFISKFYSKFQDADENRKNRMKDYPGQFLIVAYKG